jgi:hypothetical protein
MDKCLWWFDTPTTNLPYETGEGFAGNHQRRSLARLVGLWYSWTHRLLQPERSKSRKGVA